MKSGPNFRYRFGPFELNTGSYELLRAGHRVALRPKVFDLIRYLIERRDVLVSKDELLDALWPGQHVAENAVPWTVGHARRALGQRRNQKLPIETVHGRGYRWLAPVDCVERERDPRHTTVEPAFVGRTHLLDLLETHLVETSSGRGAACLLTGEAGIGKTRCLDEVSLRARRLGFSVWRTRCIEDAEAPVFHPWIMLVRSAFEEGRERARARALLRRLSPAATASARRKVSDRELGSGRLALFENVGRFLVDTSQHAPALIVLDDLHCADLGSLELLATIAAEFRNSRVLLLMGARQMPELEGAKAAELTRQLERLEVPPLEECDVAEYLKQSAALETPNADLCRAVRAASSGNPLFMQEIVATLVSRHDRATLSILPAGDVQPGVRAREIMRGRFDALPASARAALRAASILGETFDSARVGRLAAQQPLETLDALESSLSAGFIDPEAPNRYRFRHALLRAAAYDSLNEADRVALHRAAAEVFECAADSVLRASEIAHHYYQSLALGDHDRVARAAARAGDRAMTAQSFSDAARFYGWALESVALMDAEDTRRRAELQLARARALRFSGSLDAARATIAQLVDVASVHAYADLLIQAARILRPSHSMGAYDDPLARTALQRAVEQVQHDAFALRAQAMSQLACLPPIACDIRRSQSLSAAALEVARESDCKEALAEALAARLYALSGPHDVAELFGVSDEMLAMDHHRQSWVSVEAWIARHAAFSLVFKQEAADGALSALAELARKRGFRELTWHCDRMRAQRCFLSGGIAEAEREFARLELEARRLGMSEVTQLCLIQTGLLSIVRQGLASHPASQTPSFFDALPHTLVPTSYRASIGRLAVGLGHFAPARALLEEFASSDFETVPRDLSYLSSLSNLAVIAVELRDRPRAERLYELLSPFAEFNTPNSMSYCEGAVAYFLALISEFLGRESETAALFECSLELNRRLGDGPILARTYYDSARYFASRGDSVARVHAARARELAEGLEMSSLAQRTAALQVR